MIYICVLGYNNDRVIHETLHRTWSHSSNEERYRRYFFDPHYPLGDAKTRKLLCEQHAFSYVDLCKNQGQDGNFKAMARWMRMIVEIKDDDVVCIWDPDNLPSTTTMLYLAQEIFKADAEVGFLVPRREPEWVYNNQGQEIKIAGQRVRELTWPGGWPMSLFAGRFFRRLPELLQQSHEFYGGTEGNVLNALKRAGLKGYMFTDISDHMTSVEFDGAYIAWKQQVITQSGKQISFDDWLKENSAHEHMSAVRKETV